MTYNFYPGPSALHPYFKASMDAALQSGILSLNHRSKAFEKLYQACEETLLYNLKVPEGYKLLFSSSATECWEIIAQSVIENKESLHIYSGAFGEKSYTTTNKITKRATSFSFDPQTVLQVEKLKEYPVINLCQNESANGSQLDNNVLAKLRSQFKQSLICIDATSSLAGQDLNISNGDIWYSSVQKCFGLPSGMAVILVSPKAQEQIKSENINKHYNDFINILNNREKWQTPFTPNILDIHALNFTQKHTPRITEVVQTLLERRNQLLETVRFEPFIENKNLASLTTVCFKHQQPDELIKALHAQNLIIGSGYGQLKSSTFRIANFPSISDHALKKLLTKMS